MDISTSTPGIVDVSPSPYQPQLDSTTGLCGICPAGCGIKIYFENGRLSRIAPLKGHPQGTCCPRGAHAAETIYSPNRLPYPLIRTGPRGAGQFERASWDEALDIIAARLKSVADRYGPQAVVYVYQGAAPFERSLCDLLPRQVSQILGLEPSFSFLALPTPQASVLFATFRMASLLRLPRTACMRLIPSPISSRPTWWSCGGTIP